MTVADIQAIVIFLIILIVLLISLIPECILVTTYAKFSDAPISLKIYTIIHIGVIIVITLHLTQLRPADVYLGM